MEKKLNKVAKDINQFLLKFLLNQKKTDLIKSMKYGLLPGGKKIRSKLIIDVGKIFEINYKNLIYLDNIPQDSVVLDLMSSWVSHLPNNIRYKNINTPSKNIRFIAKIYQNSVFFIILKLIIYYHAVKIN